LGYRYLDEEAPADVAFEATGATAEELFAAAGDATLNVMVADLDSIGNRVNRAVALRDSSLEMLLFQYLQELIYYKDAERLLLRSRSLKVHRQEDQFLLTAELQGEELDPARHSLQVDVKAVTMYMFRVWWEQEGWRATVVLDI
jgi:SHS2 domain-containing protein